MHGLAKGRREGYQFRPRKHLPNLVFTHCLAWSWDFVTISLETVGQRWKRLGFERRGCKKGFSFICWPLVGEELKGRVLWLITDWKCGNECSNHNPGSF